SKKSAKLCGKTAAVNYCSSIRAKRNKPIESILIGMNVEPVSVMPWSLIVMNRPWYFVCCETFHLFLFIYKVRQP
ncbi:hypothetical protein, partial [Vibrio sp. 10N.261.49.A3]|uniref:hypothetical protein n=1 Tax=Vibrio sp. 10N.261.49.A3 TaxID=3229669 RepID=UPI00354B7074